MNKVRIADFNISINSGIKNFDKIFRDYLSASKNRDISIVVDDAVVNFEKKLSKDKIIIYETTYRLSAILRLIADSAPFKRAFLLHSACFDVDGVGVAFAPRGAKIITVQNPECIKLVFLRFFNIAILALAVKGLHYADYLFGVLLFDEIIVVAADDDFAVLKPDNAVQNQHNAALVGIKHNIAFFKLAVDRRDIYNIPVFAKQRLHAPAARLERHFVCV